MSLEYIKWQQFSIRDRINYLLKAGAKFQEAVCLSKDDTIPKSYEDNIISLLRGWVIVVEKT